MKNMLNAFKRCLNNCMIKGIYIKENIKDYIVLLVNHSGLNHNLLMENVLTVVEKFLKYLKKLTF